MSKEPSGAATAPPCTIRNYRPADRAAVRALCCDTGFLGQPIDPVFSDRSLFADFLTNYYLEKEPESAFIMEINGEVRGYLLGCRQPLRNQLHNFLQNFRLAGRVLRRYLGYDATDRRFIHWMLSNAWREVPAAPRRTAHFHINLLPDARSMFNTRLLIDAYLQYLADKGEKRVYGQMVSFANRRGEKMFQRYGFRVLNKTEITKYRRLHPEPVYLCTVIKDLEDFSQFKSQKT